MLGEQLRRALAAAQVLGAGLVSEPAEIDGPLHSLPLRHLGEVPSRPVLALLEVAAAAAAHRVDEVVGDLHPLARALERSGVEDVAHLDLEAALLQLAGAVGFRTRHRTRQPRSARASASFPPMNPVAPVTRAVRPSPARVASPRMSTVVLFTRDLRVRDNPGLAAAARRGEVVPLFVVDDTLLSGRSGTPNRIAFLLDSLHDLDQSLRERGARLVIRRGDPVKEALLVARDSGADALHVAEDVSGYAHRRQDRLERACEKAGTAMRAFSGVTIVPPGELVPAGGDHYRVFTPYWRAWRSRARPRSAGGATQAADAEGRSPRQDSGVRPALAREAVVGAAAGGETAGRAHLDNWLRRDGVTDYERDEALDPTPGSRLSPYLHFGCLSAGELFARARSAAGPRPSCGSSAGATSTTRSWP